MKILDKFYKICPEADIAAKNNLWHREMLNKEERQKIRKDYNNFLIHYSLNNPNKLFIIEGIDIYKVLSFKDLIGRGFIIKGSSVLRCFLRRYKRDKTVDNQKNISSKIKYLKMIVNESKIFYFRDRKILNNLIQNINNYKTTIGGN